MNLGYTNSFYETVVQFWNARENWVLQKDIHKHQALHFSVLFVCLFYLREYHLDRRSQWMLQNNNIVQMVSKKIVPQLSSSIIRDEQVGPPLLPLFLSCIRKLLERFMENSRENPFLFIYESPCCPFHNMEAGICWAKTIDLTIAFVNFKGIE